MTHTRLNLDDNYSVQCSNLPYKTVSSSHSGAYYVFWWAY